MKFAIIGTRTFTDYQRLKSILDKIKSKYEIESIISGGASGADTMAEIYARENNIPLTVYKADWDKYGKRAGFIRNKYIIDDCDICIAFWDSKSKGTKHSIDLAKSSNKKVFIIHTGE